ncbi:uncharacterized protein LOC125378636 [Haliotis rufescens]|uniref:uncharacterized protein LOC125378636 n=1 Tax=Haliotis rufescens TaxID=6454 RepID=UPI00201E7E5C|nr:uncharacterized protein LOC125378636 [Haliotis rufescens]
METIEVTGVDGNAKVKNSTAVGIQSSGGELPSQIGIKKMKVTGVKGNAEVYNSVATGIDNGKMGSIENRQQTYNIENAHGVVVGQDMRGATVDQGGITGQRSGPKTYFEGKALSDISEVDIIGLLHEKKLEKHIPLFQTHGIDGDLLSQLDEDELKAFGIDDSFEKKKILNLKKCLPK